MQPYLFEGELMRFNRTESLIGQNLMEKLQNHTILIFGIGGVGSYACEAISRSGFQKIIIVDDDIVDISNINRQLIALDDTIGLPKVEVMKQRILNINPSCEVLTFMERVDEKNISHFFSQKIDFVLECIDDLKAKVEIAAYAEKHNIPIIASMGFANKTHPELIQISSVNKTSVCPLAKAYRYAFRNSGLSLKIPVVFSTEEPIKPVGNVTLGSTAFVPSSAGLLMASYVFNKLLKLEDL
jgi:tRNA A37 threonylcarbamoyladenosine dehydratase